MDFINVRISSVRIRSVPSLVDTSIFYDPSPDTVCFSSGQSLCVTVFKQNKPDMWYNHRCSCLARGSLVELSPRVPKHLIPQCCAMHRLIVAKRDSNVTNNDDETTIVGCKSRSHPNTTSSTLTESCAVLFCFLRWNRHAATLSSTFLHTRLNTRFTSTCEYRRCVASPAYRAHCMVGLARQFATTSDGTLSIVRLSMRKGMFGWSTFPRQKCAFDQFAWYAYVSGSCFFKFCVNISVTLFDWGGVDIP